MKARAASMLGEGYSLDEICEALDCHRSTIWRWRKEPEFRAMVDEVVRAGVGEAAARMRSLAPLAVDAFERGLKSNVRVQALQTPGGIEVVELPDNSLAVRTADILTRRIPELMPQAGIDVNVDASEKLAALVRRLDGIGDDGPGADGAGPLPPPPGSAPVRPDESLDPDEA